MPELSLRERALGFLSRREYSRLELKRKLAPHVENKSELETLLDDFVRRGWLSEQRFTEQIIHARSGKYGSRRIVHELKEKGISAEAVAALLPQLQEGELETARAVRAKKFGTLPADAKERMKQMRFLASRGFGQETIYKVVRGSMEEDDDV